MQKEPRPATGDFDVPNPGTYKEQGIFQVFKYPANQQGWKIHVPAPQNYKLSTAYQKTLSTLQMAKIPHKYVKTVENMRDGMDKRKTQRGKFLTIYPANKDELLLVVASIDQLLNPDNFENSPITPGDKQVGERNKIAVRYGSNFYHVIVKPDSVGDPEARKKVENYMIDSRSEYKPEGIRDPFDQESVGADGWIADDRDVVIKEAKNPAGGFTVSIYDSKGKLLDKNVVSK